MADYADSVFLNVPFDARYRRLFNALLFAVHDCGFVARSALSSEDSGEVRVEKIYGLVESCRWGIHDISRAGIERTSGLARFNMPLELGLFLGAKRFGSAPHRSKKCLVLDREKYRYQKFCSDIAGQDIRAHGDDPKKLIGAVRDWLSTLRSGVIIPGRSRIATRYADFRAQLPRQAESVRLEASELTAGDYTVLLVGWLKENPW